MPTRRARTRKVKRKTSAKYITTVRDTKGEPHKRVTRARDKGKKLTFGFGDFKTNYRKSGGGWFS